MAEAGVEADVGLLAVASTFGIYVFVRRSRRALNRSGVDVAAIEALPASSEGQ